MDEQHQIKTFSLDPEFIASHAKDTHAQTQSLLSIPRPPIIRVGDVLGASFAYGMPGFNLLPAEFSETAKEIGFRPVCFVRSGFPPLLIISTPFWLGPEGFVRLDANADGNFHIRTLMTDGADIVVTKTRPESSHPTFYIPATGDFKADYLELIEVVRAHMDATGATPIFMADKLDVRAVFRAFNHLHRPTWAIVLFLWLDLIFLSAIAYLAYYAST